MATKLSEITTQYHTFEDNQVLTKDQLNQFISYFEDQDRLSRVFLSGVGIVCGFTLKFDSATSKITISQGAGITTDGDLLKLKKSLAGSPQKSIDFSEIDFTHYKKFEDNFAGYRFFRKLVSIDGKATDLPIDMLEILPEKTENSFALSSLAGLKNKVVMLYLEAYEKKADLCTAIDCDNQGVEQVARLRVLLVSKADADYIAGLDSVFSKHHVAESYFDLPELSVRRVVLNKTTTANYNELKRAYYIALTTDPLIQNLSLGISKIAIDFKSILQLDSTEINLKTALNRLKTMFAFGAYSVPFDVQYRYDCIKDIVDTYNELKCLLTELQEECCPDINAFPKHLMLGDLDEIGIAVKQHRHSFYKSPILNGGQDKIELCRNLFHRIIELINGFQTSPGKTKITPSNKLTELGKRSIPFYYKVEEELLRSWNYAKTKKNRQNTNLSYHVGNLAPDLNIQNPLNYNIDRYDFYRIEGHQGKNYQDALDEIDTLKTQNGLAFDVKALSVNLNTENLNIDDYQCEFEDLNVLLHAWTAEQDCILAEVSGFFSGFSTAVPGKNIKEPQLDLKAPSEINIADNLNFAAAAKTNFTAKIADTSRFVSAATFAKSNVISDNLTLQENALGNVMKLALDETVGGSVNDIIAKANFLVADRINTDVWKAEPEIKAFVIDQSIELMAFTHVLSQKMPSTLVDINSIRISAYKLTMNDLCSRVKKLKTSYQSTKLSAEMKAFMGILINQLSNVCCSGKKLQILLEEVDKRKHDILVRLQLSSFVEKNPGLEHLAGVQPGGTFVLVYLNKIPEKPVIDITGKLATAANLPAANLLMKSSSALNIEKLTVADKFATTEKLVLPDFSSVISDRFSLFDRVIKPVDLPDNTVVADFSLPYMCCSDCAPVNFIIQKPPVSLRLEKDRFCLGKDTSPLLFDVSPADGIIKTNPEVAGVTIEGAKLFLDSEIFPDNMLGRAIHFTVNDQITTTLITIYRAVQFDFAVPESPTSETKITFIPSGNLDGATFLWSFGDDNLSTERNPTHQYSLPVNMENKVTVSLTVTAVNGVCHDTVEHEITFKQEDAKINLDKLIYCSEDRNPYPFTITPKGAVVKIEGNGVSRDASGTFAFIPANAPLGETTFTLNGTPSGLKITVNEAPVARFVPSQVGNQLILNNTSAGAKTFTWSVNQVKFEKSDNSPFIVDLTPNSPTIWNIILEAVSETCGSNATKEIQFQTKVDVPVNTCIDDTKALLVKDRNVLGKLDIPTSDVVHRVWQMTSTLYGGTTEFQKGVLNDVDNYLNGKYNTNLETLFVNLMKTTTNFIAETDRLKRTQEFAALLELFRLQLQLFYNILGCQSPEVIKKFTGIIQNVMDQILEMLRFMRQIDVSMPETLKAFMKAYTIKISQIELLIAHITKLKDENLI